MRRPLAEAVGGGPHGWRSAQDADRRPAGPRQRGRSVLDGTGDLGNGVGEHGGQGGARHRPQGDDEPGGHESDKHPPGDVASTKIGRASCRERV